MQAVHGYVPCVGRGVNWWFFGFFLIFFLKNNKIIATINQLHVIFDINDVYTSHCPYLAHYTSNR